MKLIDAHHHLWIPEQSTPDIGYGWLRDIGAPKPFGDPTSIQRDYEWLEFIAESTEHEVTGTVFLQTDGALPDPVAETNWVSGVLTDTGLPHRIVSFVDLDSPNAATEIEKHQACGLLAGVRQIVSRLEAKPELCFAGKHYLRSKQWQDNLAVLADKGLTFDLQLYPEQMHEAAEVFSQYPSLTVVVDHTGSPWDNSAEGAQRWHDGIAALSQLPNCVMKLSGFGMFKTDWSAESVQPQLQSCLSTFGPNRMLFGSNYPVDKLMASYDEVVNRVAVGLTNEARKQGMVAAEVLEAVFIQTARRVYDV